MNAFSYFAATDMTELPKQVLMILGGAAVGAVGLGVAAQLLTRWLTMKKLHPLPTTVARGVGGVALGLLTAMWIWQGGGWGPGGTGGFGVPGNGPGATKTDADKGQEKTPEEAKDKDKISSDEANPPSPESVLRMEVLTDDAVRKLDGQQAVSEHRYYRLEDRDAKDLQTLSDLRQVIEKRVGDKPPLQRLDVVTRADSPDKSAARVEQVRQLASDFRLKVEFPPR